MHSCEHHIEREVVKLIKNNRDFSGLSYNEGKNSSAGEQCSRFDDL